MRFRWTWIVASMLSLGLTLSTTFAQTSSSEDGKRKVKVKTSPAYPEIARHMNVTGKVKIEVIITPDGKVRSTRVVGGHPLLLQACHHDGLNRANFLLSGAPRDEEKVNKGLTDPTDILKRGESQASVDLLRTALIEVESTEVNGNDNFAKPLLAKRHQVDSGDSTVSDLQIFYLQKDPTSWLTKSSDLLYRTNQKIKDNFDDSTNSADRASNWSLGFATVGTLFAVVLGLFVAFYTAKSITQPLQHLITLAREIGASGDLNQNIDINGTHECA